MVEILFWENKISIFQLPNLVYHLLNLIWQVINQILQVVISILWIKKLCLQLIISI